RFENACYTAEALFSALSGIRFLAGCRWRCRQKCGGAAARARRARRNQCNAMQHQREILFAARISEAALRPLPIAPATVPLRPWWCVASPAKKSVRLIG